LLLLFYKPSRSRRSLCADESCYFEFFPYVCVDGIADVFYFSTAHKICHYLQCQSGIWIFPTNWKRIDLSQVTSRSNSLRPSVSIQCPAIFSHRRGQCLDTALHLVLAWKVMVCLASNQAATLGGTHIQIWCSRSDGVTFHKSLTFSTITVYTSNLASFSIHSTIELLLCSVNHVTTFNVRDYCSLLPDNQCWISSDHISSCVFSPPLLYSYICSWNKDQLTCSFCFLIECQMTFLHIFVTSVMHRNQSQIPTIRIEGWITAGYSYRNFFLQNTIDISHVCLSSEGYEYVTFEVFMAVTKTNYLFLDMTPCNLVGIQNFKSSVTCHLTGWEGPTFWG
jgi:hypothetical protein